MALEGCKRRGGKRGRTAFCSGCMGVWFDGERRDAEVEDAVLHAPVQCAELEDAGRLWIVLGAV